MCDIGKGPERNVELGKFNDWFPDSQLRSEVQILPIRYRINSTANLYIIVPAHQLKVLAY